MVLKHQESWVVRLLITSISSVIFIFILDYKFVFLPIHGVFLFLYLLAVFCASVWATSTLSQKLLRENQPIDLDAIKNHKLAQFACRLIKNIEDKLIDKQANEEVLKVQLEKQLLQKERLLNDEDGKLDKQQENRIDKQDSKIDKQQQENKQEASTFDKEQDLIQLTDELSKPKLPDLLIDEVDVQVFQSPNYLLREKSYDIDDRINDFVDDIEKRFLSNWYCHISSDRLFLDESHKLLEDVVRRFLQVVVQIDHKKIVHSVFVIVLRHLKEFRRATKRTEKNGGSVEENYR